MADTGHNRETAGHIWHFFRAGGFSQATLSTADDLRALSKLDQKLWVALSCPAKGLEFDERTLALIDTDNDGRIRVPEVLAAVNWTCALLKDPAAIFRRSESLPLAAINDAVPEGKALLASARQILAALGKADAAAIAVEDTTDTARIFAQTRFNGDGVIPADSADSEETRKLITEIMECVGSQADRSGKPGVDKAALDKFLEEAKACVAWWAEGEKDSREVFPLGKDTVAAASSLQAVRAKVEDYFARCRLAAFDPRALPAMNRQESEFIAIGVKELTPEMAEVAAFPLATIEAGKPLPLSGGLNPAWSAAMSAFRQSVVGPILGERKELTEADWLKVKAKFARHESWLAGKAGAAVERLGIERVRRILEGDAKGAVESLIAQDKALEAEHNAISTVDRLVRYHRDLGALLDNFVSFRDFYQRRHKAVFQAGTLYLDQRSCDLCVRVSDMARHSTLAHLSRAYLAYCEVSRPGTGEKMTIAAAFSSGDSDNLMAGRNGIFYDRKGRDWDATVVKIVENPISIRQAFLAPYKRLLRWVEEQVAKRAAAADAATTDKMTAAVAKPVDQKPKFDVGVVAALGVAVGGVTAALGMLLQAFFGLGMWMPLGFVALVLLISGPSMVIAWLKLRQRNLGPILDANGWAVNANARLNIPLGRSLTAVSKLPAGARLSAVDPFAESTSSRNTAIAVAAILAATGCLWYFGALNRFLPERLQRSPKIAEGNAAAESVASTDSAPAKAGTGK